jgi:D-glycero-D-manno-heptose 1,7-bisphosphate phosphatase
VRHYSAAFLDRDGTVIREGPFLSDPTAVELLPNAGSAIALLNERHIPVVIITNQSGIGRGLYTTAAFEAVQAEMEVQLRSFGAHVDAVYHCPHDPEQISCRCRKPRTALFERASRELGQLSLSEALFVGDQMRDVLPGLELGGRAVLLRSVVESSDEMAAPSSCTRAPDLFEAVHGALLGRADS